MITAENQDSTSPLWWTLAQMLVWILQQFDLLPQDAEQFCNELNPKTIEVALNALVGALFNALYGADKGMPMTIARIPCGHGYKDLAAFFLPLPSLEPGAVNALKNELSQFIRRQPDIQFNPTWGRWTWPVRVSAAQTAPTSTRPSESAVADEAEPTPGSEVGPEESQPPNKPGSVDAPTLAARTAQAGPACIINVGSVDPAIAHAIAHAIKRARPAHEAKPIPGSEVGPEESPPPAARAEESGPTPVPETLVEIKREIRDDAVIEPASAPATPAPVVQTPRRFKQGPQLNRSIRVLCNRIYPPDGRAPDEAGIKAVTKKVERALADEKKDGLAPKNEAHLPPPSHDVVGVAMRYLRGER